MKFLWEQETVKSSDEFENGCITVKFLLFLSNVIILGY